VAGDTPHVIVIGGPNGAGKTTAAPFLLRDTLGVTEFVNADTIAQGLSAFSPEQVAIAAGRVMLARLKELAQHRANFAFETTLASRSFAPWLSGLVASGYAFHLIYLWLPSADFAVNRVAHRVQQGGHGVPEITIRRRYGAGLRNFFRLYQPLATTWLVYDNSAGSPPRLIAAGEGSAVTDVADSATWEHICRGQSEGD
jgi:predicted ABC-type ATPase